MSARRHYVYYRVDAADAVLAVEAARAMQAVLRASHPGLAAELLRRPEASEGQATLMEVYGLAPGTDAGAVEIAAAAATERWRRGPRHLEIFEPVN